MLKHGESTFQWKYVVNSHVLISDGWHRLWSVSDEGRTGKVRGDILPGQLEREGGLYR